MNQLDATLTIYWSKRSAQHVSGNLLPIFLHTVHGVPRNRSPNPCLPQQQDTICCKNLSLTLLKMGKRLPETCWADLIDQEIVIVASSWFFCITLPTLMMHGQTNQIHWWLRCSLNRNCIQRQMPYQANWLATKWYQSKTVRMYTVLLYTKCTAMHFLRPHISFSLLRGPANVYTVFREL